MPTNQSSRTKLSRCEWVIQATKAHNSDKCLLYPFPLNDSGYGVFQYGNRRERAHRVAFFITYGHWPTPEGRHTCDTPACFNPRHIVEGTHKQNGEDMSQRGRAARGERHGSAKLTAEIVREIRSLIGIIPQRAIGERYGIHNVTVSEIKLRKIWAHLT
jgi:hypothetical protein